MTSPNYSFDWRGDEVKDLVERAGVIGIDATLAACVLAAKPNTPYQYGNLRRSIRFTPAQVVGGIVEGEWGSFDVNYALWHEIGTKYITAKYYLRNASDQEYPRLPHRMAAAFRRLQ